MVEFSITHQEDADKKKHSKEDLDLAYAFSKRIYKEFGTFIKAVVLFGSSARKEQGTRSDVDILVIVDDLTVQMSPDIVETYRIITEKIIAELSTRLHITSLKLTTFHEYVHAGDPIAINMLRDGVALIDTGFFFPLKVLLKRGKIRPTPESVWTYYAKAPQILQGSRALILQAIIDLYWAVIDAAHAALMAREEIPPSPDHVSEMISEKLVATGVVEIKYAHIMHDFYTLAKAVMRKEITHMTGAEYDRYYEKADAFVRRMQETIKDAPG